MSQLSKTNIPCDCGWLSEAINDPDSGISYHPETNSVCLAHGQSIYSLYHCPFCGGKYPDASQPLWVPIVPQAEFTRLKQIVAGLKDSAAIISALGPPDYDAMMGTYWSVNGVMTKDLSQGETRNLEYYHLSEWLNIEFYLPPDGPGSFRLAIKSLSPRHIKAT